MEEVGRMEDGRVRIIGVRIVKDSDENKRRNRYVGDAERQM